MPESSTATLRGRDRAATVESQPIFVWPHSSSIHGSLGNVVRAARCQQLGVELGSARSSTDVVRKSGPSQSGSAYATRGESRYSRSLAAESRAEKATTRKLRAISMS